MNRLIHQLARFISSPKGAKIVLVGWLLVIIALSGIAPGAKKYAISSGDNVEEYALQFFSIEYKMNLALHRYT
ncbi:hypothetical protein ACBP89_27625, partial [Aneurinibacillus aneurinilyticus]|uniref:hypothetical protein n=1 Tax=Aneurinibacillus aneurinilyticus TaxID=1391 RepID=UPI0035244215